MAYFSLYSHCYLLAGLKKSSIYDLLQKRIFWIDDEIHQEFLQLASHNLSNQEISLKLNVKESIINYYANISQKLDLGAVFEKPKVNVKYRPFMHEHLEKHNGYYRPIGTATIEISSNCTRKCEFCKPESRLASSECACGIYSDTPKVTYNLEEILSLLAYAKPSEIEVLGGDPYCNRADLETVMSLAAEHSIPVRIKTSGLLLVEEDILKLKENNAHLSLVLPNFLANIDADDALFVENLINLFGNNEYTNFDIILTFDENHFDIINQAFEWFSKNNCRFATVVGIFSKTSCNETREQRLKHFSRFVPKSHTDYAQEIDVASRVISGQFCWQDRLAIMANGDVRACIASSDVVFGKLHEKNILDIFREDRPEEIINYHQKDTQGCAKCEFSLGCNTCAVATTKIETTHKAKAWNCAYRPEDGKFVL